MKVLIKKPESELVLENVNKIEFSEGDDGIVFYDEEDYVLGFFENLNKTQISILEAK